MQDPREMLEELRDSVASEDNKLMVANLASHTTRIAALALADPEAAATEMSFVRAATANLTTSEAARVQHVLTEWLAGFVRSLVLSS